MSYCFRAATILHLLLCCLQPAFGQASASGELAPALRVADLDPEVYRQWVDGAETAMKSPSDVKQSIWTVEQTPPWNGVNFGESKLAGARHLRLGFNRAISIGSVITLGNCSISVLKPSAKYPGNLSDDSQWLRLERVHSGKVTQEAADAGYAVWVLPPGTKVRAMRFTRTAQATDKSYSGNFMAYPIAERLVNIAPQGRAFASVRDERSDRLVNEIFDNWGSWDNGSVDAAEKQTHAPGKPWAAIYWSTPVPVAGLNLQCAGLNAAEIDVFEGPNDRHPREGKESDWRAVKSVKGMNPNYPHGMGSNWIDFGRTITTRAIRIRMTEPMNESGVHPHMAGNSMGGKRYFLGEIMVFSPAGKTLKDNIIAAAAPEVAAAPVQIPFTLAEPGIVTLVIEDAQGKRIRNLVSETPFPAGKNLIGWDCMDDLGRDVEASTHGLYNVPGKFVPPGEYRVRGLVRKPLSIKYEFSVYFDGTPPWETADKTGGWLTNHTPPSSMLFVPAEKSPTRNPMVYIGSHIAEGGAGLAWVDLEGRKLGGRMWVGGNWTGAQYLAGDVGKESEDAVFAYVGSVFESELRLTGLTAQDDKAILKWNFPNKQTAELGGIAAHNGLLVCSLPKLNQLLFVNAKTAAIVGAVEMTDPRGVYFETDGRLLVLRGNQLARFAAPGMGLIDANAGVPILKDRLEDPRHIAKDAEGRFYISDRGTSHQIKVFAADTQFVRAIGNPAAPKAGPYDPNHMNNPNGIAVDLNGRLWVAEQDNQPKRVSVWNADGTRYKTMYGPPEYGGGGRIDGSDKSLFYYNGMQFRLDWEKGAYRLDRVFHRPEPGALQLPGGTPELPHYVNGKRYWSNSFNSDPVAGYGTISIWMDRDGIAEPVATFGIANHWDRLKQPDLLSLWPKGVDPAGDLWKNLCQVLWSDTNGDAQVQPDEVKIWKVKSAGGIIVQEDLSFLATRMNGDAIRLTPQRFTPKGVPVYDWGTAQVLAKNLQPPASTGGDQGLIDENGRFITTLGLDPYHTHSVSGALNGTPMWSYPNLWPGLHASHEAAVPERRGELVGVTRFISGLLRPRGSDVAPIWSVNANMGNVYLFTTDGLFVATLFHDIRLAPRWVMPVAKRGMEVSHLTFKDENFWPSITQTPDGNVYIVSEMTISRIDGLDSLRSITLPNLRIEPQQLADAQAHLVRQEALRQKGEGRGSLRVEVDVVSPTVDGDLAEWKDANWVPIDRRGTLANFDSKSKPYSVDAAISVSKDRLNVAFRTNEPTLLANSGEIANAPFKTGGALDVMIGTNPSADPSRTSPVQGDIRLLVTRVGGKTRALVYRAVMPGTTEKVPFSSPWRTISFDRVDDVSAAVQLADKEGAYELSIPLSELGLTAKPGTSIKGDVGVLRGNGFQTNQRVYWNNKATGITADVPSEAELRPSLWGTWEFSLKQDGPVKTN